MTIGLILLCLCALCLFIGFIATHEIGEESFTSDFLIFSSMVLFIGAWLFIG